MAPRPAQICRYVGQKLQARWEFPYAIGIIDHVLIDSFLLVDKVVHRYTGLLFLSISAIMAVISITESGLRCAPSNPLALFSLKTKRHFPEVSVA